MIFKFHSAPIILGFAAFFLVSATVNSPALSQEEEDEKKPEKWDVASPPDPAYQIHLDVDEGTWMSVDVSPDGSEVVFDLLGDLYTMSIDGGEARALTEGIPWDMQPRYSPDGKFILFTSDRGGGDNIWVMDREGKNPKAVTSESFRLLNNAAWGPTSETIIARKHFTSGRSLGAGEIWLYHRTGGKGVQLVKRPNDQKDLGEPVFAPDGKSIYYSQDSTPGPVFEYSKDSNTQIYVVKELDLETGETEVVLSGPGGAVRPTPSPDGKLLAFVRRVRFQSTLFLRELESGREWSIYSSLDRDMQETWAVHGVYPNMAWTPDGKSIVFWAGGKIRRIDVSSKETKVIPFRVKVSKTLVEGLRFPVDVSPSSFDVKMLRWVEVSPVGDRVVFQALGHLYVRDLPEGTPRRLTGQTDHFEVYPSFSRDGKWITYATWDDEDLGSVKVVSADGGEGRSVTSIQGHYIEPRMSPDGKNIVYRKIQGGGLRSGLYGQDPGVYRIDREGTSIPVRVTRNGSGPHFADASDRVFFTSSSGGKRVLRSSDLSGNEVRDHLRSENATELRVSPDGKWVAFIERYNVFVLPLLSTGGVQDIGPKTGSLPMKRVSKKAGEYVHWSGDSSRLHWSLGPELFGQTLNLAFAHLEGSPGELPDPPESGRQIGFQAVSDVPEGSVVVRGAKIITMRGDEVIPKGSIVIKGNRIVAVGPVDAVEIPRGAHIIEGAGLTVIPGLVDVHQHGPHGSAEIIPQQNWVAYSWLSFGVTTIHDPSNDTSTIFAASEMARAGQIVSPRVFSTGTILYGAAGSFKAEIENLDDARFHVGRMKAVGAISVKSYNQPRRDQRQQVITAARELGMMVVPEGGSLLQHNLTMIVDGHTGVEHSIPVANIYDDIRRLWSLSETGYTPTLVVGYGGIWGENYWYAHTNVWENDRLLAFVPRERVDARSRRRVIAPKEEYNHVDNARICKELTDVGVKVNLGAHGQREGLGSHWEMWMFAQGGMTVLEAIRACTWNPSFYLGMEGEIGSIEPGKLADLAILDGDPLQDIRNSQHVRFTVLNGRVYDSSTMNEVGNFSRGRKEFYWERGGAAPKLVPPTCGCLPGDPH